MGYIENYLTVYDELELEEAGLDVDELAEMDWGDRYDAIEEAGLSPMDYDYGFLDDYQKIEEPEKYVAPVKKTSSVPLFGSYRAPAPRKPVKSTPKKLSRRERKAIEKAVRRAQDELETDILMMMEVFSDY